MLTHYDLKKLILVLLFSNIYIIVIYFIVFPMPKLYFNLQESINAIDIATGKNRPAYYMINCAHTTHFEHIFDDKEGDDCIKRIGALKPNGSKKSHEELNNGDTLDTGDPEEFGRLLVELKQKAGSQLNALSGCCGTNINHMKETIKCLKNQ